MARLSLNHRRSRQASKNNLRVNRPLSKEEFLDRLSRQIEADLKAQQKAASVFISSSDILHQDPVSLNETLDTLVEVARASGVKTEPKALKQILWYLFTHSPKGGPRHG